MSRFLDNHEALMSHFDFIQDEDSVKESSNQRLKEGF